MQILSSLQELDANFEECEAARRVSDDALRAVFQSFRMDVCQLVPKEMFSDEGKSRASSAGVCQLLQYLLVCGLQTIVMPLRREVLCTPPPAGRQVNA